MRIHIPRSLSVATFALCIVSDISGAQGKGHDKDKEKHQDSRKHVERVNGDVAHPVIVRHPSDVRHGPVMQQVPPGLAKKGGMPPGLAKKGGLPPGQAKKLYRATDGVVALREVFGRHGYTLVRTQPYGNSQYVYYRLGNGSVQRAVVVPGADRLAFQNVPQLLLQEVLARLY